MNTISRLPFLRTLSKTANAEMAKQSVEFKAEDDLDLGIYYLRTLSNVFRWAPDAFWGVLATRLIEEQGPNLAEISRWIVTHCAWSQTNTQQPDPRATSPYKPSSSTFACDALRVTSSPPTSKWNYAFLSSKDMRSRSSTKFS